VRLGLRPKTGFLGICDLLEQKNRGLKSHPNAFWEPEETFGFWVAEGFGFVFDYSESAKASEVDTLFFMKGFLDTL
jgi:hypothetical protein